MKRQIIIMTCLLAFQVSVSMAQPESEGAVPLISVGGHLGISSKPDVFRENWAVGAGGNLGVGVMLPSLNDLELSLSGDFIRYFGESGLKDINAFNVFLTGRIKPTEGTSAIPFILVGLGYFGLDASGVDAESAVGGQIGAGVSFPINTGTGAFLEGAYVIGDTDFESTQYALLRAGVSFLIR